jgi:hypothetical protein
MEALRLENIPSSEGSLSLVQNNTKRSAFIEANTVEASLEVVKAHHVIPVFHKDNEPLISHAQLVDLTSEIVHEHFKPERILEPSIRLSHPIKGRIPEARNKPANELEEWEKTLWYERMAFVIEIPSISDQIDGQKLSLIVGGVKAYNLDNLNSKQGVDQHFKIFMGFQVSVCTNLCIWTDGLKKEVRVKDVQQLAVAIDDLVMGFDAISQIKKMEELKNLGLTESQFAHLVGKCKMYQFLSTAQKKQVPELLFGDQQIAAVCKDFYKDKAFSRDEKGDINLWKLYNLFTGSNKSSFIDSFADRAVNASELVSTLSYAIRHKEEHWFLN